MGDGADIAYWDYVRFVLALGFVVGLIIVAGKLMARYAHGTTGGRGGKRRLGVVESLPLDGRRRLILVRRDSAEHLILIGQTGPDLVVEAGIVPPSAATEGSRPPFVPDQAGPPPAKPAAALPKPETDRPGHADVAATLAKSPAGPGSSAP